MTAETLAAAHEAVLAPFRGLPTAQAQGHSCARRSGPSPDIASECLDPVHKWAPGLRWRKMGGWGKRASEEALATYSAGSVVAAVGE